MDCTEPGAGAFGRPTCLEVLLKAGADPSLSDESGTNAYTAVSVSWEITKGIADLLQMPLDQGVLESGRDACERILKPG